MQISPIGFNQAINNMHFKGNTEDPAELIRSAKSKILEVAENKFYLGATAELTPIQKDNKLYEAALALDKALSKLLKKGAKICK